MKSIKLMPFRGEAAVMEELMVEVVVNSDFLRTDSRDKQYIGYEWIHPVVREWINSGRMGWLSTRSDVTYRKSMFNVDYQIDFENTEYVQQLVQDKCRLAETEYEGCWIVGRVQCYFSWLSDSYQISIMLVRGLSSIRTLSGIKLRNLVN